MRRLLLIPAALAAIAVMFAGSQIIGASAASNVNVHVHDNYYHPAGAFDSGSGTDHTVAQANCQGLNPSSNCDATITAGDSVTWVAVQPPSIIRLHTVTECTDNTFSTCGAAVDPANPINDSGFLAPPTPGPSGWPYGPITFTQSGTYYYRCEQHPATMRGRVVVLPNTAVGGNVELFGTSAGDSSTWAIALAAAAVIATLAVGGVFAQKRIRRDD